ncbi:MAG: T9SS type A sorting domain-containing protein [Ignavibacteria bacterium]|nr:T9SS type A sorting domain-containing protein [Ignavibacteria bacterium]
MARCLFGIIICYTCIALAQPGPGANAKKSDVPSGINSTNSIRSTALSINDVFFPFNNIGNIAIQKNTPDSSGIRFKKASAVWGAGFALTGYANQNLWGSRADISLELSDFAPGQVGKNTDPGFQAGSEADLPFSASWDNWRTAVANGAPFYDGDKDGIYNPVDKNHNSKWDPDEDRPDFLLDKSIWCVYNDAIPPYNHYFPELPQGIEIQQTIFADKNTDANTFDDGIVFVRYRITNTGFSSDVLDSVLFTLIVNPTIGTGGMDLFGCDTLLQCGFGYKKDTDSLFTPAPPAVLVQLLQGPPQYIPGVTFIDKNANGVYDNSDVAIDTAFQNDGPVMGQKVFPGARNAPMTAFCDMSIYGHPNNNDLYDLQAFRLFQFGGKTIIHTDSIDPCNDPYGNGGSLPDCKSIAAKFVYSGDPVTGTGWLNTSRHDHAFGMTTGPFKLEKNKPVELIFAYIVAQWNEPVASVTKAKHIAGFTKQYYQQNFPYEQINFNPNPGITPSTYLLAQNYPNPFNNGTNISYYLPENGFVSLKLYDGLGSEVMTMVNNVESAGPHTYHFSNPKLPSGIYYYTLHVNNYTETKKLVFLK